MFCKNCGNKINENDKVCRYCNSPIDPSTIPTETERKSFKAKTFLSDFLGKINVKPIFNDSTSKTPVQIFLSNRYLALTLCLMSILIVSLMNCLHITLPLNSIIETNVDISSTTCSMNDMMSTISIIKDVLKNYASYDSDTEMLITILNMVVFTHNAVTVVLFVLPVVAFAPLLLQKEEKKYWIRVLGIGMCLNFVVNVLFFIAIKWIMETNFSEILGGDVKIGLTFWGFLFIALYMIAIVLFKKIEKRLKEEKKHAYQRLSEIETEGETIK